MSKNRKLNSCIVYIVLFETSVCFRTVLMEAATCTDVRAVSEAIFLKTLEYSIFHAVFKFSFLNAK